jgi:hypothetical protein
MSERTRMGCVAEQAPRHPGAPRMPRIGPRFATIVGAAILTLMSYVLVAPAAQASLAETCWNGSHGGRISVDKKFQRDGQLDYGAKWHWCGVNGKVTKFVVDSTWPAPGTTQAYVDVRPENSGKFGKDSYPIFIKATLGKKSQHDDIALMGDGQMIVACRAGLVRYNGECYDPAYLDGRKNVWGGKTVVECADEATRKAVKKIIDEHNAADTAKQGSKQLGKKLLTVPGIFKCMLWDN